MICIVKNSSQRIGKDCERLIERYLMLGPIRFGLAAVPFELGGHLRNLPVRRGDRSDPHKESSRDLRSIEIRLVGYCAAGLNFGSVTPSPVSSNTTSTGMPMWTFSIGQPMTLLQKRGPSSRSTHAVT